MPLLGIDSDQPFADPAINVVTIKFVLDGITTPELATDTNEVFHTAPWGEIHLWWWQTAGNRTI